MLTCYQYIPCWIVILAALFLAPPSSAEPPTTRPTYVRVSPRDARYLETHDGRPYIPIGLNMIYPPFVKDHAGSRERRSISGSRRKASAACASTTLGRIAGRRQRLMARA